MLQQVFEAVRWVGWNEILIALAGWQVTANLPPHSSPLI